MDPESSFASTAQAEAVPMLTPPPSPPPLSPFEQAGPDKAAPDARLVTACCTSFCDGPTGAIFLWHAICQHAGGPPPLSSADEMVYDRTANAEGLVLSAIKTSCPICCGYCVMLNLLGCSCTALTCHHHAEGACLEVNAEGTAHRRCSSHRVCCCGESFNLWPRTLPCTDAITPHACFCRSTRQRPTSRR